ncbi:protein FAR1-RELATED SEQUENCE 5-like [Gossypium australe]|uniref:Protein FAR1-RELATED SEQUENCE n=1 Tax=Gossypium australe TaxID=47621 RepID=A0A5B6VVZ8_9ROSI|nr:protein FAR1-RELATED SEQUENCE 5-like [Gossypium australe]
MHRDCIKLQIKDLGFIYAIQVDESGHMGNYFWVDGRSRMAYKYFGDVVTFDATYLTNRYSMPFVLPNATHKSCIWNILQKLPEHLAHIYNKNSFFHDELHHCIHDTVTIEEF